MATGSEEKIFSYSEQSECFASLSIEGAKYVVLEIFLICF
jgi:lipid-binding SYLF domain-containing protein